MTRDSERWQAQRERDVLASRLSLLTPREREVVKRVVADETTKVIAAALGLSTKTVDFHRAKIMNKMQVHNVAELVRMMIAIEG